MALKSNHISVSAPAKIHLLGEHAVVHGKPALVTTVDLRLKATISPNGLKNSSNNNLSKIIEPIIKKELNLKIIPGYKLEISSEIPVGCGMGSSAAVSSAYIATLLLFLKIPWDLELINKLTYEAEKVFHGNPSGADNSTIIFGGLIWYRKETPDLKLIQKLNFSIPKKLANNFVLINTGQPKESTKEMVSNVGNLYKEKPAEILNIFNSQEMLTKELLQVIKDANEDELIKIIKMGEKNLENIGVTSKFARLIIRDIEKAGGAAKICGAGGAAKSTGILLAYHKNPDKIKEIAEKYNLPCFQKSLGVEGLRIE